MFAFMRKYLLLIVVAAVLTNCNSEQNNAKVLDNISDTRDSFAIFSQMWYVFDSENPKSTDIYGKVDNMEMHPGIIFMYDSTVLENPKGVKAYGTYTMNPEMDLVNVKYDDGREANYMVARLNEEEMHLDRALDGDTTSLQYKASNTYWPKDVENPFSKENYAWSFKPEKSETDEQIKERVKDCVKFYQYFFEGFVRGGAKTINFDALPDCFKWYPGAIFVQKEDELNIKWINCFYSKEEALKGRKMVEEALLKKEYDWNKNEKNWLKQTALVLKQLHEEI